MKRLGVIEPGWPLSPQAGDWDAVKDKAWEARCMEVYAAMIDRMDRGIARIVGALKKTGRLENTLLCFFQDNGGCAEGMGRGGQGKPRAEKPPLPPMGAGDLQTDMIPKKTRDGYPLRKGVGAMPGPADTYIGYGRSWANVSNTPFREYKHWVHEGGISTPLIVHWPARIPDKNVLRHTPAHLIDLMATCADVAGAAYPAEYKGETIKPKQGVSLVPVFEGKDLPSRALFWEHERNCAVRQGKWKLVGKGVLGPDGPREEKWELYDIDADRSELKNLAAQEPERVKAMSALFLEYAKRCDVLPLPGGKSKAKKKKK
jgi:arylsulfatase